MIRPAPYALGPSRLAFPRVSLRVWAVPLLVVFALVARRPDVLVHPQLWAEDGNVFFGDETAFGPVATLVRPYAGYQNLVPRMIADAGSVFPLDAVPRFYVVVSFLVAAGSCSLFALETFRFAIRSDRMRACVCLVLALAPNSSELLGNIANLQWYLAFAVFLSLAIPARESVAWSRSTQAAVAFAIFISVASAPECVLALPFVLWRARDETGAGRAIAAAFTLASVVQVWTFAHAPHPTVAHAGVGDLAVGLVVATALRGEVVPLAGTRFAQWISMDHVLPCGVAILTATAALVAAVLVRLAPPERARVVALLYLAVASVLMALALRGENLPPFLQPDQIRWWNADRYFFCAEAAFIVLVGLAVEELSRAPAGFRVRFFVALFSSGIITNFHRWPYPAPLVAWAPEATRVRLWEAERATWTHRTQAKLVLPIEPPGWKLVLPPLQGN
jgi:hypothetical protein